MTTSYRLKLALALTLFGAWGAVGSIRPAFADPGVTLGIGKLTMNVPLRAGGQHQLPSLPVTNSGTSAGSYAVVVNTMAGQEEMSPDPAWFSFRPQHFDLQPGQEQDVAVTLTLPWMLQPGTYACLLQTGPAAADQGAAVGIAAAARLTFTVEHGNILTATIFNLTDALQSRAPWSYLILVALGGVVGYPLLGRVFGIRFSVERRK